MSAPVTMLARAEAYLAERRRLGFVLDRSGSLTQAFARFVDASGHEGPLTSAIVLRWAKEHAMHADPFTWAQRLNVLRPFARHLADAESGTTFPEGSPFGRSKRRLAPHIFTPAEVDAIIVAARALPRVFGAGSSMLPTLLGLLAATGLRISEALSLRCGSLDEAATRVTVKHSKFGTVAPDRDSGFARLPAHASEARPDRPFRAVLPRRAQRRGSGLPGRAPRVAPTDGRRRHRAARGPSVHPYPRSAAHLYLPTADALADRRCRHRQCNAGALDLRRPRQSRRHLLVLAGCTRAHGARWRPLRGTRTAVQGGVS